MLQILPLISALPKGGGGFIWAGNKMPRARTKTYHIHRPPTMFMS